MNTSTTNEILDVLPEKTIKNNDTIGTRLSELLKNKGVSAYVLADETGMSNATLSRIIKKDAKPNIKTLKKITDYFNVSREWFLTGSGKKNIVSSSNTPKIEAKRIDKTTNTQVLQKETETNDISYIDFLKEKVSLQTDIIDGLKFKIKILEDKN